MKKNEESVHINTPKDTDTRISTQNRGRKAKTEDKTAQPNLSWNTLVSIVKSRKQNIPAEPQSISINPYYISPKALTTPKIGSQKKRSRRWKRQEENEYQYDSEDYIIIEEEEESEDES